MLAALTLLSAVSAQAETSWRIDAAPDTLKPELEATIKPWRATDDQHDDRPVHSDEDIAVDAVAAVFETLKAAGYYDPQVRLRREPKRWTLHVEAGEPVRVGKLVQVWQGDIGDDERFRPPAFPMAEGDILHQGRYEDFKQQVADQAQERGYFDAHWVEHDIAIDLKAHKADITLRYDSGRRYRFGEVRFLDVAGRPLTGLDAHWLETLTPFKPGDFVSSRKLLQFQKSLLESRYFTDVRVSLQRDQADGLVLPVEVRADNRQPNKMSVGLGYATDVGPRLTLEWQRHLLNARGHGMEASSELSAVRQQGEIKYRIPLTHPVEDTLQFVLGAQRDDIDDTITRQVAVAIQRVVQPLRGWQTTYGVRVSDERYERDSGEHGAQLLVVPGVSFTRLSSRGGLDPTSGMRQFYQIEGTHPALLSDAEYVLVRTGLRWLETFAGRHMVLARVDAGAIFSPDFDEVPPSVRFYAGGDNSVRGYDYRSLSPRDSTGETVGGQYLAAGSLEYNWRWLPTWRPAVLIDAGNAFN
ncbi:MAG: autotransporter assembly complex family protein, partial [Perlucidibaca sp.]